MKRLLIFLIFAAFSSIPVYAETSAEIRQMIITTANEAGVDPAMVLSIAKTESGFNQSARSKGGHVGVFQLSPATAKTLGYNPYKTDENIKAGVLYYKKMYNMFGNEKLALAAYNSGPVAVKKCGNKVPANSQKFVNKIMSDYKTFKSSGL